MCACVFGCVSGRIDILGLEAWCKRSVDDDDPLAVIEKRLRE